MEALKKAILKELVKNDPEFLNSLKGESKESLDDVQDFFKEFDTEIYKSFTYIREVFEL